ncbi:MAG: membrane integrity-associated transporter subunit PqiC, partial [Desulfobacterales bacterium]|nr:membrane integrity-associated transporter subunit PqiC [Desulfobacterales bacterium]
VDGVSSTANSARPTHILNASIEDFYEDDTKTKWEAVLTLSVTLTPAQPSSAEAPVLLQKTYQVRKTMEQNNPRGLAMAMSKAMAEISGHMLKDIGKSLEE